MSKGIYTAEIKNPAPGIDRISIRNIRAASELDARREAVKACGLPIEGGREISVKRIMTA